MNERVKNGYLSADLSRIFTGRRLYIAVTGIVITLFFALEGLDDFTGSVLYVFISATFHAGFTVVYVFCAYPFASCFSEDIEDNYIRYAVIRGNLKRYVLAKVVLIMLTAIVVLAAGCTIFALICRGWLPWSDSDILEYLLAGGSFRYFLADGPDLLWYTLYGVQQGILAGVLALFSAYISLFVTNRMLVLAAPAFLHQILTELSYGLSEDFSLLQLSVFNPEYNFFENDLQSFGWALMLGLLCAIATGYAIYRKVGSRI